MRDALRLTALGAAITLGVIAANGPGSALAQGGGHLGAQHGQHGRGPDFGALDSDGDGWITRAELDAMRAARFAEADSDGDGKLSAAELEARGAQRAARMMKRLDANGDALLAPEEIAQARRGGGPDRMFARADSDGDGSLSQAEFEAMRGKSMRAKN